MAVTELHGRQLKDGTVPLGKLAEDVIQADGGEAFAADQSMGGNKLTNVAEPVASTDAATKGYVDGVAVGIDWKPSVRAASTGDLTLSGTQTIDGVSLSVGNRVLAKNQTAPEENGIYVVAAGAWSRATDADSSAEVTPGMATFVEEGTVNGNSGFTLTTDGPITLGTTELTFTQFTGLGDVAAGGGLTKTGNTLDVGAGDGISVAADAVTVNLDGATLAKSGSGLKIADGGVGATQLASGVAGDGLAGGGGSALSVNTDDATIEKSGDALRVKDGGITDAKVAVGAAIALSKLAEAPLQADGGQAFTGNQNADGNTITNLVNPTNPQDAATKDYVDDQVAAGGISLTNYIVREAPTGAINGSNTSYVLANTPEAGTEQVFLNGLLQRPGAGNDYTISGDTITYLTAPVTGDWLVVSYIAA